MKIYYNSLFASKNTKHPKQQFKNMEKINLEINSKFLDSVKKWSVEIWMKDEKYGYWHDCCFDPDREKAEKECKELAKEHIDFIRELKKPAETREEVLVY